MTRVRLKDIAEAVGVSTMTVSNAYNAPDRLSSQLRERILATASTMGYHGPGGAGRMLRSGTTNAYGVLFAGSLSYAFLDPYSVLLLAGFSKAMEARDASIVLLAARPGDEEALNAIRNAALDGLTSDSVHHPALGIARERGLRTVTTNASADGDYVAIDDHAAGAVLGRHVRDLGHRRVTVVAEELDPTRPVPRTYAWPEFADVLDSYRVSHYYDWRVRLAGLLEGLGDAAVTVVVTGPNKRESGRIAGELILDGGDPPSAVVAVSDVMALGVLDAAADRGLVPGRDLSVAGFDDIPDAARAGLTTVRQPIVEKGRRTAELLLGADLSPRRVTLPHELVTRPSTGPAPTD